MLDPSDESVPAEFLAETYPPSLIFSSPLNNLSSDFRKFLNPPSKSFDCRVSKNRFDIVLTGSRISGPGYPSAIVLSTLLFKLFRFSILYPRWWLLLGAFEKCFQKRFISHSFKTFHSLSLSLFLSLVFRSSTDRFIERIPKNPSISSEFLHLWKTFWKTFKARNSFECWNSYDGRRSGF